jgi:hypothetical protein
LDGGRSAQEKQRLSERHGGKTNTHNGGPSGSSATPEVVLVPDNRCETAFSETGANWSAIVRESHISTGSAGILPSGYDQSW